MVVDYNLKIRDKKISLKVKLCNTFFSQISGLMFKKNSLPLLFIFKKPKKISIHSFFCKKFIAIWFLGDTIVDMKIINSNKFSINSKNKFDKLLEIPSNNPKFKEIINFIDER